MKYWTPELSCVEHHIMEFGHYCYGELSCWMINLWRLVIICYLETKLNDELLETKIERQKIKIQK